MNYFGNQIKSRLSLFRSVEKINFDLKKGKFKGNPKAIKKNSFSISKINIFTFIPISILRYFMDSHTLAFLILFFFATAKDLTIYPSLYYILTILIFLIFELLNQILRFISKKYIEKQFNSQEVTIINLENGSSTKILWENISTGDFVILKKGDKSPADMMILEISNNRCLIDSQHVFGQTKLQERFAIPLTQNLKSKGNPLDFKRILNGKLEFEYPNPYYDQFNGFIKLARDPKGEEIKHYNMIFREEIICSCEWIFAIALHVGEDSKVMQNISKPYAVIKKRFVKHKNILVFLGIFIVFLSYLIELSINKSKIFLKVPDILSFFLVMSVIVSPCLNFMHLICLLIHKIRLENMYKEIDNNFKVIKPEKLTKLGHSDYVFIDKTGVLTIPNTLTMKSLVINNKLYLLNDKRDINEINQISTKLVELKKDYFLLAEETELKTYIKLKKVMPDSTIDFSSSEKISFSRVKSVGRELSPTKKEDFLNNKRIRFGSDSAVKIKGLNVNTGSEEKKSKSPSSLTENKLEKRDNEETIENNSNSQKPEIRFNFVQGRKANKQYTMPSNTMLESKLNNFSSNNRLNPSFIRGDSSPIRGNRSFRINESSQEKEMVIPVGDLQRQSVFRTIKSKTLKKNENMRSLSTKRNQNINLFEPNAPKNINSMTNIHYQNEHENDTHNKRKTLGENPNPKNPFQGLRSKSKSESEDEKDSIDNDTESRGKKKINFDQKLENPLNAIYSNRKSFGVGITRASRLRACMSMTSSFSKIFKKESNIKKVMNFNSNEATTGFERVIQNTFNLSEAGSELKGETITEVLQTLLLCKHPKSDLIEDDIVREFAEKFGIKAADLEKKESNAYFYGVSFKKINQKYGIVGINNETSNRARFSIVLALDELYILFVSGNSDEMLERVELKYNDRLDLEEVISFQKKIGLELRLYGIKILSEEIVEDYVNKKGNMSNNITNHESLEAYYSVLESGLRLVCTVGYMETLQPHSRDLIEKFHQMLSRIWIVSSDNEIRTNSCASNVGLYDDINTIWKINAASTEEATFTIKSLLGMLKNGMGFHDSRISSFNSFIGKPQKVRKSEFFRNKESKDSYALIIDGPTFEIVSSDDFLLSHFAYLAYFSSLFIAYDMNPLHKMELINIVKTRFPNDPTIITMGSSFSDSPMMGISDISIGFLNCHDSSTLKSIFSSIRGSESSVKEVIEKRRYKNTISENLKRRISDIRRIMKFKSKISPQKPRLSKHGRRLSYYTFTKKIRQEIPFIPQSDILVSNHKVVIDMFLREGFNIYYKSLNVQLFGCFCLIVVTVSQLCYKMIDLFSSTPFIAYSAFIYFNVWVPFFGSIFISLNGYTIFDQKFLSNNPMYYSFGSFVRQEHNKILVMKVFVPAFLCSIILYYLTQEIVDNSVNTKGQTAGLEVFQAYYYLILNQFFSVIIYYFVNLKHSIIFGVFSFVSLIIFLSTNDYEFPIHVSVDHLIESLSRFELWIALPTLTLTGYYCLLYYYGAVSHFNELLNVRAGVGLKKLNINKIKDQVNAQFKIMRGNIYDLAISSIFKKMFKDSPLDPQVQEMIDPIDYRGLGNTNFDPKSIRFSNKKFEEIFWKFRMKNSLRYIRIGVFVTIIVLLMMTIYFTIYFSPEESSKKSTFNYFIAYQFIAISAFYGIIMITIWTELFNKYIRQILLFVVTVTIYAKILYEWTIELSTDCTISTCALMLGLVQATTYTHPMFFIMSLSFLSFAIKIGIQRDNYGAISNMFWICLYQAQIFIFMFYMVYKHEMELRKEFLTKNKLENQTKNIDETLSILLPKFIKDRIELGNKSLREDQGEVVIIFIDICGFNEMISEVGPEIVLILDGIFRRFDSLCSAHGVQKIETVGKTYMACSGLAAMETSLSTSNKLVPKTRRAFNFAFDAVETAKSQTWGRDDKSIEVKIGIHFGKCIAGVIGYHKPQFSLIGDTVNTASRMCSTGESGRITLSEEAYNKIKNSEIYFLEKDVFAKGKGNLKVFQAFKYKKEYTTALQKYPKRANMNFAKMAMLSHFEKTKSFDSQKSTKLGGLIRAHKKELIRKSELSEDSENVKEMRFCLIKENISELEIPNIKSVQNPLEEVSQSVIHTEEEEESEKFIDMSSSSETLSFNPIFLSFNSKQTLLIQEFIDDNYRRMKSSDLTLIIILFVTLFMKYLLIYASDYDNSLYIIPLTIRPIVLLFLILLGGGKNWLIKKGFYKRIVLLTYFISIAITTIQADIASEFKFSISEYLEFILNILIFSHLSNVSFNETLFISTPISIFFLINKNIKDLKKLNYTYFPIFYSVIFILININYNQRLIIRNFNTLKIMERRKNQQNKLLLHLLPQHMLDKFLSNPSKKIDLIDEFNDVTILFADIAGFTGYSSSVSPENVVNMLSNLFTEFDKMCLYHNVYKVYTIGDCYVVLGVVDAMRRNPVVEAKNVVEMGFSMIEIIRKVREKIKYNGLEMRIGIHTVNLK